MRSFGACLRWAVLSVMKPALAVVATAALLLAGACSDDDGSSPQRNNTGDTLEEPTTNAPSSTSP